MTHLYFPMILMQKNIMLIQLAYLSMTNWKPQKVVVRVFGVHVEYMRSLPLHFSQQEIKTEHKEYSDFEYQLCLTPELTSQLLAMGEKIEVMEPIGLRGEIRKRLLLP